MESVSYSPPLLTKEERETLTTKEANRLYQERLRVRRVQAGVCRVCGKHPPADGKIDCRFCSARSLVNAADRAAKRYQKLSIAGMCVKCGEPAQPGFVRCKSCSAKSSGRDKERQTERREKYKAQGMCLQCGKVPPVDGLTHCSTCIDLRKKSGFIWRSNAKKKAVAYLGGACQDCGLKTDVVQVYDFHHRDPSLKDFTIAKFITSDFDTVIAPELDKCDLLCANCHRIRHATNPSFEELKDEEAA